MKKKLLSIVMTLCMVFTMFTSLGVTASAEELSCTYTDMAGETYTITESDIAACASEMTLTLNKWNKQQQVIIPEEHLGEYALFTDVLDKVGAEPADCGYDFNGEQQYKAATELYLFINDEGTIQTAVDKGQGFMWWKGITKITAIDHDYSEGLECAHEYTVEKQPETVTEPCGAKKLFCSYTDLGGETFTITEDDIAACASEKTLTLNKWNKQQQVIIPEEHPGEYALFTDVLDKVGAEPAPCGYDFNGEQQYKAATELYLFINDEGTIQTAVDKGQGFMWWKGITEICAIDHDYSAGPECAHEYIVEKQPETKKEPCGINKLYCTYTDLSGETFTITEDDITDCASEMTLTLNKWNKQEKKIIPEEHPGEYALFTDVLDKVGAEPATCGYDFNSEQQYKAATELYLFINDEGTIQTAVDKGQGFMWWKGITEITALDHDYTEGNECSHEYMVEKQPEEKMESCGALKVSCTYTDINGQVFTITPDDIAECASEKTLVLNKWNKQEQKIIPEDHPGEYALFTDVLDKVGAEPAPCGYDFNGEQQYKAATELYLFINDEGTIQTAVDKGQGFMWWKGITEILAIDHDYSAGPECAHEYIIEKQPETKKEPCGINKLYCTYTDLSGETFTITEDDIADCASEMTLTLNKWNKQQQKIIPEDRPGEYALFTDVLDKVSASPATCGYDFNGEQQYKAATELYLFINDEGVIQTAVDEGQGFMWWSGITEIDAIDHDFSEGNECIREYMIEKQPETVMEPCGALDVYCTYIDLSGETFTITPDDIADCASEMTLTLNKWNKQQQKIIPEDRPGEYALFTDVLDKVGASPATCGYDFNGEQQYKADTELYLFINDEGLIQTAVDEGQGFMWWSGITEIDAIDHDYADGTACIHEYMIEKQPETKTEPCGQEVPSAKIYRLYNPKTKEHLFTPAKKEYDTLPKYGWKQEGAAWYAPKSGSGVYRLYNPKTKDHHYTASANEAKVLTTKYGWTYDNNKKPLFYSGGKVNIYRLYNKAFKVGSHHFTGSKKEYDTLPQYGWKQEGAAFKCVKLK